MATLKDALDIISKLSYDDLESLKTIVLGGATYKTDTIENFTKDNRFSNGRVCPICGCIHIVRNGHRKDGTQRYVCKDCGKSFVINTNSITSGTRKDFDVWKKYIDCMMNGLSIRKTADICGIHRNTAFLWRHKILDALQNMHNSVVLECVFRLNGTACTLQREGCPLQTGSF